MNAHGARLAKLRAGLGSCLCVIKIQSPWSRTRLKRRISADANVLLVI